MLKRFLAFALLAALFAGCSKKEQCTYDECSVVAPAAEIQKVKDYLAANNITNATQHCSGAFFVVKAEGTGATPNFCSQVVAAYEGRLAADGKVFDKNTTGILFGLQEVIRGWTNLMPKIKSGGQITMYIPASLAYGAAGSVVPSTGEVVIPPNAMLIFDVTLKEVY